MTGAPRFAVLGRPIQHSQSPRVHQRWLARHGLAGTYEAVDVDPGITARALRELLLRYDGVNLTMPLKVRATEVVDRLDPFAERAGACNVVRRAPDGQLEGANTDGPAFLKSMAAAGHPVAPVRLGILGAGGVARAVARVSLDVGADVRVFARDPAACAQAWKQWEGAERIRPIEALAEPGDLACEVLISCVPAGAEVPERAFWMRRRGAAVGVDLNYWGDRAWLDDARSCGLAAWDGWPMFIEQAALSFRWWTGLDPDRAVAPANLTPP